MSDKKLVLEKLPYGKKDLNPVMSEDTINYHRDNLAAGYVKRYNKGEGDLSFNEAGAFLHNIFFPQLKPPSGSNKPSGSCLELIERKWDSFDNFKEELKKVAMGIQGSGWVYMSRSGDIKTIKNHEVKNDIVLLIDWWEHAWALDYRQDKGKYLDNIWKIINWEKVNDRINIKKESINLIKELIKISNNLDEVGLHKDANKLDGAIRKYSLSNFLTKGIKRNNVDKITLDTLIYIRDNYKFTDEAKNLFDSKISNIIKNREF